MECPKCNSKYKGKLNFCPKCGYLFDSKIVDSYSSAHLSYYLETYINNNFESNGFPKVYYLLFGWFYAITKKMYRTTLYLLFWFLLLLFSIKHWTDVLLIFIRLYPVGVFIIIFFVVLFVKYYITLLTKCINNDILIKCKKILKNVENDNQELINNLIKDDNKNNYKLLTISIIVTITITTLYFLL